jgi:transposase-like protein
MGQVLHGCATTTEAIRRAIQNSQASLRALSKRYGINPKTVAKWKRRASVADLRTGPKEPKSTSLSITDEAIIVAFRQHTLLALDDCLYALQATIPHLTRASRNWTGIVTGGWHCSGRTFAPVIEEAISTHARLEPLRPMFAAVAARDLVLQAVQRSRRSAGLDKRERLHVLSSDFAVHADAKESRELSRQG